MKNNLLFVFDLDGTLIDENGFEKESIQSIFTLIKNYGTIKTAIMTGKGNYFVDKFCNKNKIQPDYICGYEGNCISSSNNNTILYENILSETIDCVTLTKELLLYSPFVFVNKKDGLYTVSESLPRNSILAKFEKGRIHNWKDIYQIYVRDIDVDRASYLVKKYNKVLNIYYFPNRNTNKSSILISSIGGKMKNYEKLFEVANTPLQNGWYFGDGINDIEITTLSTNVVAVNSAHSDLKHTSKYALSNTENIYSFILNFFGDVG